MGKWWLTPKGEIDLTGSDHDYIALLQMLNLERGDPEAHAFRRRKKQQITSEQAEAALRRGADRKAVEFLMAGFDPRLWAVREWGWIRVHDGNVELWRFDENTLDLWQKSRRFWGRSTFDTFTIGETSTGDLFRLDGRRLQNVSAEPGALKHYATGIGAFRNPPSPFNPTKMAFAFQEATGIQVRRVHVNEGDGVLEIDEYTFALPARSRNYGFADWMEWARLNLPNPEEDLLI